MACSPSDYLALGRRIDHLFTSALRLDLPNYKLDHITDRLRDASKLYQLGPSMAHRHSERMSIESSSMLCQSDSCPDGGRNRTLTLTKPRLSPLMSRTAMLPYVRALATYLQASLSVPSGASPYRSTLKSLSNTRGSGPNARSHRIVDIPGTKSPQNV